MSNALYRISALCILLGAAFFIITPLAAYPFAVGAAGLAIHHFRVETKQMTVRERRLHRLNIYASILMVVASALQFQQRNEWVICLFLAAVFQLYVACVAPKAAGTDRDRDK